jgi:hypothetical protein
MSSRTGSEIKAIQDWRKKWEVDLAPEDKTLYEFIREDRVREVHASAVASPPWLSAKKKDNGNV